jgi:hypothetical protein
MSMKSRGWLLKQQRDTIAVALVFYQHKLPKNDIFWEKYKENKELVRSLFPHLEKSLSLDKVALEAAAYDAAKISVPDGCDKGAFFYSDEFVLLPVEDILLTKVRWFAQLARLIQSFYLSYEECSQIPICQALIHLFEKIMVCLKLRIAPLPIEYHPQIQTTCAPNV